MGRSTNFALLLTALLAGLCGCDRIGPQTTAVLLKRLDPSVCSRADVQKIANHLMTGDVPADQPTRIALQFNLATLDGVDRDTGAMSCSANVATTVSGETVSARLSYLVQPTTEGAGYAVRLVTTAEGVALTKRLTWLRFQELGELQRAKAAAEDDQVANPSGPDPNEETSNATEVVTNAVAQMTSHSS